VQLIYINKKHKNSNLNSSDAEVYQTFKEELEPFFSQTIPKN
jgi:hypothetical protein